MLKVLLLFLPSTAVPHKHYRATQLLALSGSWFMVLQKSSFLFWKNIIYVICYFQSILYNILLNQEFEYNKWMFNVLIFFTLATPGFCQFPVLSDSRSPSQQTVSEAATGTAREATSDWILFH